MRYSTPRDKTDIIVATKMNIGSVYPATSLGYTTFFYAMQENHYVKGYNVSYQSENTTVLNDITVSDTTGPIPGLPGTHMTVSAVANPSGGASLYVFYQVEGDDITVFTRDLDGGQWTQGKLPIPDD